MQVLHVHPEMFKNVNQQMGFGLLSESESKLPGLEVWTTLLLRECFGISYQTGWKSQKSIDLKVPHSKLNYKNDFLGGGFNPFEK